MKNLENLKKDELKKIGGGEKENAAYLIGAASTGTTAIIFAPLLSTAWLFNRIF